MIFLTIIISLLLLSSILKMFKNKNIKIPYVTNSDTWAVVTGCTDGIGFAFAEELAGYGYNIVMVSRDVVKLGNRQKYLEKTYKIKTLLFPVDISRPGNFYERFANVIQKLNVKTVVNNVGISYKYPEYFHRNDFDLYDSMIECNVMCITKLTYIILNYCQPREITFINMSSMLGEIPGPLYTIYSSTKSYVTKFTEDLSLEYNEDPLINFYCIKPWLVSTKMSRVKPTAVCPSPRIYVSQVLKTGKYIPHEILTLFSTCFKIPFFGLYFKNLLKDKLINIRNVNLKKQLQQ